MTEQKTCYCTDIHPFLSTVLWARAFWPLTYDTVTLSPVALFSQMCIFREIFRVWFMKLLQPLLLNKWLGKAAFVLSFWLLEIIVGVALQTLLPPPFPWKENWKFLTHMESKKSKLCAQSKYLFLVSSIHIIFISCIYCSKRHLWCATIVTAENWSWELFWRNWPQLLGFSR